MTIKYPDISSAQSGISLAGAPFVCCKATESTNYTNPDYHRAKDNARAHGCWFFAYHFLHGGNAAAQARHCHSVVGTTPLMLDVEHVANGPSPSVADATEFVDTFRRLGGKCYLVYMPKWYWQSIGSPSLTYIHNRRLWLVSSAYPASGYSANGEGWEPYGGMTPVIWQYTQSHQFNGHTVDFNAFRGTHAELVSILKTGRK